MRSCSKPVSLCAVRNRSGSISYRVLGTIAPKSRQRKQHFACLDDALATQAAWKAERLGVKAALRPKITRLTVQQLAQAEAAVELLKDTGLSLIDIARHAFRNPPPATTPKKPGEAHGEFLADRQPFIGACQHENLRLAGEQFARFVGEDKLLADIATADVRRWLEAKGKVAKKTWNAYRNDLSTFFEWCVAKPRAWILGNPVKPIPQHEVLRSLPERLEIDVAQALMRHLEKNHPEWCLFFAVALFMGVRPDMTNGEMAKLADAVRRDGAKKYLCNGVLHITAEIAKDKRPRQTRIPPNVAAWIERYPVSDDALCPGSWVTYGKIREKFKIPHDGLRHTAISAHVSMHGSFAEAAHEFGNSEQMIRTHYFNRMTKEEARALYAITPTPLHPARREPDLRDDFAGLQHRADRDTEHFADAEAGCVVTRQPSRGVISD